MGRVCLSDLRKFTTAGLAWTEKFVQLHNDQDDHDDHRIHDDHRMDRMDAHPSTNASTSPSTGMGANGSTNDHDAMDVHHK
jgi:hypothetical protein